MKLTQSIKHYLKLEVLNYKLDVSYCDSYMHITLIIMLMILYIIHVAVSLGTLRLVSKTMAQQVPTLSMVIPYLELSTKQEYLVDRIKGLMIPLCIGYTNFTSFTTKITGNGFRTFQRKQQPQCFSLELWWFVERKDLGAGPTK